MKHTPTDPAIIAKTIGREYTPQKLTPPKFEDAIKRPANVRLAYIFK